MAKSPGLFDVDERLRRLSDIGDQLERARSALRAHHTQIDPNGPWFQIPSDVILAAYPYEDFELMASRDHASPQGSELIT